MALKHFLASAATAAIVTAFVAVGAGTAQATPLPVPPGPINLPIYTQPGLPGFHLPPSIRVLKPGPLPKPGVPVQFRQFRVAPTSCDQLFPGGTPQAGAVLSADHTVRSTTDTNLVALLNGQPSLLNCSWTNSTSGLQLEVSVALINSSLIPALENYFGAAGYIGEGVGGNILGWTTGTSPVNEHQEVSTNDFWVAVRTNDTSADDTDRVIQSVWALNGVSFEDFE